VKGNKKLAQRIANEIISKYNLSRKLRSGDIHGRKSLAEIIELVLDSV